VCCGLGVALVKALRAMPLVSRLVPPRGGQ